MTTRILQSAMRAMVLVVGTGLLAACSSSTSATFDLTAPRDVGPVRATRALLVVGTPSAVEILNSDRVVVRPRDGQMSYLAGAQWADQLPNLVQTRLIQTFENAHRLAAVGRPGDKLTADATLVTEIRTFEMEVAGGARAMVEISAKIVRENTGRIAAAQVFRASQPSAGTSGPQATAALDAALQTVLREIVVWTSARV